MNRRMTTLATLFLLLTSTAALAHNGVEHVLGTIKSLTDASVTVETPKHTSVTVALGPATKYANAKGAATVKDMKIGDRVAIEAKEGKPLTALSVKIGAGAAAAQADHK
jgi:hypothetical protein